MLMPTGHQEAVSRDVSQQPDRPHHLHPSILRVLANTQVTLNLPQSTRQSFKSLDRSLKSFLRFSNLPGLEYRLRLAGYNTLSDLYEADEETLCAHGFTPLMARRLLNSLEDYIIKQLDRSAAKDTRIPFELVRKGQKISSDPTEKMKALPTFGKQNFKRQRRPPHPPKMSKKRSGSSKGGGKVAMQKQPVSYVRLLSEENIPHEPIFPNVLSEDSEGGQGVLRESEEEERLPEDFIRATTPTNEGAWPSSVEEAGLETGAGGIVDPLPASGGEGVVTASEAGFRRSVAVFQEFFMPDEVDVGEAWIGGGSEEMSKRLRRCSSVPADYRFHSKTTPHDLQPQQPWCMLVRSYSCPPSLAVPLSQIESTLAKVSTSHQLPVLHASLQWLCSALQASAANREEVRGSGGMDVMVDLLMSLCTDGRIVGYCFKIIKYLTREGEDRVDSSDWR